VVKKHALLGLYTYAEFATVLVAMLPIMAAVHAKYKHDPTQRVPGRWMRRLGRTASRLSPIWKFTIEGEAPADIRTRPYVVIANHESQADPFLLSFLPWDMRWVAKQEIFEQPLTGWAMRLCGDIPLRRGDGESVRTMMDECKRALAGGIPIMMFPEGTRSKDGELLAFRDGAFRLAIEAGVPVLPVAITGTRQMRPKHSKWFGKAHACAKILEPIATAGMTLEDVAALRDRARDAIASELSDLRARYASASEPPTPLGSQPEPTQAGALAREHERTWVTTPGP